MMGGKEAAHPRPPPRRAGCTGGAGDVARSALRGERRADRRPDRGGAVSLHAGGACAWGGGGWGPNSHRPPHGSSPPQHDAEVSGIPGATPLPPHVPAAAPPSASASARGRPGGDDAGAAAPVSLLPSSSALSRPRARTQAGSAEAEAGPGGGAHPDRLLRDLRALVAAAAARSRAAAEACAAVDRRLGEVDTGVQARR